MPRLSMRASQELSYVQNVMVQTNLTSEPDCRSSPFSKGDAGLDSGTICRLLKARGQPNDERASFIWSNAAPPRIQMFMWLLVQGRIQCGTVLQGEHIVPDTVCEVCSEQQDESPEHIINGCAIARQFWIKIGTPMAPGQCAGSAQPSSNRKHEPRGVCCLHPALMLAVMEGAKCVRVQKRDVDPAAAWGMQSNC